MSDNLSDYRFASSHEWARLDSDGNITVGISNHAQEALGDVVYVELPEVGTACTVGEQISVVESVKAASDIYSPVNGEVIAVNEVLDDEPETVNGSPYEDGWFFKIKPESTDLAHLMDADAYAESCEDE